MRHHAGKIEDDPAGTVFRGYPGKRLDPFLRELLFYGIGQRIDVLKRCSAADNKILAKTGKSAHIQHDNLLGFLIADGLSNT